MTKGTPLVYTNGSLGVASGTSVDAIVTAIVDSCTVVFASADCELSFSQPTSEAVGSWRSTAGGTRYLQWVTPYKARFVKTGSSTGTGSSPPAVIAAVTSWDDVTDKPDTFPPSNHNHGANDILGLTRRIWFGG
jgi:hypothetical protein